MCAIYLGIMYCSLFFLEWLLWLMQTARGVKIKIQSSDKKSVYCDISTLTPSGLNFWSLNFYHADYQDNLCANTSLEKKGWYKTCGPSKDVQSISVCKFPRHVFILCCIWECSKSVQARRVISKPRYCIYSMYMLLKVRDYSYRNMMSS